MPLIVAAMDQVQPNSPSPFTRLTAWLVLIAFLGALISFTMIFARAETAPEGCERIEFHIGNVETLSDAPVSRFAAPCPRGWIGEALD